MSELPTAPLESGGNGASQGQLLPKFLPPGWQLSPSPLGIHLSLCSPKPRMDFWGYLGVFLGFLGFFWGVFLIPATASLRKPH